MHRLLLLLVFMISCAVYGQNCTSDDLKFTKNGTTYFTVTQNGVCTCQNFSGDGSSLTGLNNNPTILNITSTLNSKKASVVQKNVNYLVSTTDDVILCDASLGNVSITLYSAVGNTGKSIRLKKLDSSFNLVQIIAYSSEHIDGVSIFTLNTQYEALEIMSDGNGWQVMSHKTATPWVSSSYTLGAIATAPVLGGSVYLNRKWRRIGDSADFTFETDSSDNGTSGNGLYLWPLPSGMTIDTSKVTTVNATQYNLSTATVLGYGYVAFKEQSYNRIAAIVFAYDANNFCIACANGSGTNYNLVSSSWAQSGYTNGITYDFQANSVPIAGWNP